jgi:type IV pilus assembly protein PilB
MIRFQNVSKKYGKDTLALNQVNFEIEKGSFVYLVGPTGSGKTTSLYSILNMINTPKINIMTLEDPVEYQMAGINQVQVNAQAGLTFASGLRSFLRQDPNVIMVGEIRDNETVELAVQASLTGHLVFSTLHTSSAAGALPRMVDMGAEPFLLASSMTMSVAQRICRVINPEYKEEYKPEPAVLEDMQKVLGAHFDAWLKKNNKKIEDITLFRPDPNRPQAEPEYKGRVGIYEVMKITDSLRKMIMTQKPAGDLEEEAIKNGMLFMKQDGYLKVLDGLTTVEEVIRVAEV